MSVGSRGSGWEVAERGEGGGEAWRIGDRGLRIADCGLRTGKAGEGQAAWAAWAGPAAVPRLVFSVFSIDSLVFMELLNHRFEKGTAHRGYKMHAKKRGV